MYNIIKASDEEKQILFQNTAEKMKMHPAIIEKDFWVVALLDYLFHICPWKHAFTFKGGTSLSKGYQLIKRFSEDIDLILDWRVLGYGENEPWEERSKSKQEQFNKEANQKAEIFLREQLLPVLQKELSEYFSIEANVYIDEDDAQTINFQYPQLYTNQSILQVVRLEIGALAAWTPAASVSIQSYVAECYGDIFQKKTTEILTVKPERTFWEKATILHHEANRPENSLMPPRYSRHYYDLYCMLNSGVKETALKNIDLLYKVVEFKQKFYPRNWAHYEDAKPGTLKLCVPEYRITELEKDYQQMKEMLYGNIPEFGTILNDIRILEKAINQIK